MFHFQINTLFSGASWLWTYYWLSWHIVIFRFWYRQYIAITTIMKWGIIYYVCVVVTPGYFSLKSLLRRCLIYPTWWPLLNERMIWLDVPPVHLSQDLVLRDYFEKCLTSMLRCFNYTFGLLTQSETYWKEIDIVITVWWVIVNINCRCMTRRGDSCRSIEHLNIIEQQCLIPIYDGEIRNTPSWSMFRSIDGYFKL